jgi:hypothetical protein
MLNVLTVLDMSASRLSYLRWEGEGLFLKMLGTVGTVGTLARFLGKYARFPEGLRMPRGTLETRARDQPSASSGRGARVRKQREKTGKKGTLIGTDDR